MKRIFLFLALIAYLAVGQSVFAQATRQERWQINKLEEEISLLKEKISLEEKTIAFEKRHEIFRLKQTNQSLERQIRTAETIDQATWFKSQIDNNWQKIDSIESIISNYYLEDLKTKLALLEEQREEMVQETINFEGIPREITRRPAIRRHRSNVLRREEMVLTKIENNLNQSSSETTAYEPSQTETNGLKVIFDNKYYRSITFFLYPLDGGERIAVTTAAKNREVHYLIPGKYRVETAINNQVDTRRSTFLTIDGQTHYFEGESCFGFVSRNY